MIFKIIVISISQSNILSKSSLISLTISSKCPPILSYPNAFRFSTAVWYASSIHCLCWYIRLVFSYSLRLLGYYSYTIHYICCKFRQKIAIFSQSGYKYYQSPQNFQSHKGQGDRHCPSLSLSITLRKVSFGGYWWLRHFCPFILS